MIAIRSFSSLIRLRRKLVHPASGWLVIFLLWPVGLAGQETQQVTLYTPEGSQQRTLSTPMVVDVGVLRPMESALLSSNRLWCRYRCSTPTANSWPPWWRAPGQREPIRPLGTGAMPKDKPSAVGPISCGWTPQGSRPPAR